MDIKEGIIKRANIQADQIDSCVKLTVNGKQYEALHASPNMYLNEFLRCHLHLTGKKNIEIISSMFDNLCDHYTIQELAMVKLGLSPLEILEEFVLKGWYQVGWENLIRIIWPTERLWKVSYNAIRYQVKSNRFTQVGPVSWSILKTHQHERL